LELWNNERLYSYITSAPYYHHYHIYPYFYQNKDKTSMPFNLKVVMKDVKFTVACCGNLMPLPLLAFGQHRPGGHGNEATLAYVATVP
jgi:hypothetical protein